VYAGDDLGDLPAYATVEKLRSDGVPGLLVCSGSAVPELAEKADLLLAGPGEVAAFVGQLAKVAGAAG
jgi:trehalose 6-phosphate phosphatase